MHCFFPQKRLLFDFISKFASINDISEIYDIYCILIVINAEMECKPTLIYDIISTGSIGKDASGFRGAPNGATGNFYAYKNTFTPRQHHVVLS